MAGYYTQEYEHYAPDLSPGNQTHEEEDDMELHSIPTQECDVIDKIDCPVKYVFIGQLPYKISDAKVNWMVRVFGGATRVYAVDGIWKPNSHTGEMQHKGCAHVLVPRDEVMRVVENLHHRLLVNHDTTMYGKPHVVENCASKMFPTSARVPSNPVVCESSSRNVARK